MGTEIMRGVLGHVGMGTGAFEPFNQSFKSGLKVGPDEIMAGKVQALVIWGGADISPSIYGEPVGPKTGASEDLSFRDRIEVTAVKAAISVGIPLIGVCRGAQLLCAMAGGKLVQDVQGHFGDHLVTTRDGRSIITSSVHHQMMYPFLLPEDEWDLIAWTDHARSRTYEGVDVSRMRDFDSRIIEPEIMYFHKINALCIQGHPEFMDDDDEFVVYCNDLVKEYL
jgi:GMP synthase-like glutamine amidotransferase